MTKKVIAIISVLKPVDDSRNFEKIAATIGNTNKYEINIIGFLPKKIPVASNTNFYPIFNFPRLSLQRFLAPIKTFKLLIKLKPELIIVTCAELLIVSIFIKLIYRSKILYDVQENYFRNIMFSGVYPVLVKYPLAFLLRLVEYCASILIDQCIFAEKIYSKQLRFFSSKSVVFENKASIPQNIYRLQTEQDSSIVVLYSGTIAEHYGIFDAIELVKDLKHFLKEIRLKILGYAAKQSVQKQLVKMTSDLDFVDIIEMNSLVPHERILIEMKKANFCILPYRTNKSTEGRIPTKLYECLAMEKPIIINANADWNTIVEENNAGIIYDFKSIEPFPIKRLSDSYYGKNQSNLYKWESYSTEFVEYIENLID